MPLRILHGLASIWGSMLFYLPNGARNTTFKNLSVCFPDLSNVELSRLAKESLTSTASTVMEMGKSWMLPIDKTYSLVTQVETHVGQIDRCLNASNVAEPRKGGAMGN